MTLIDTIGDTPLVPLERVVPRGYARILLKLESANPTGSLKDRMAEAVIRAALEDGRLDRSGSVVEYTGGSTGVSLAFVCAHQGISVTLVTSDAFSREKRDHMAALGARLELVPSSTGGTTADLTLSMIERAQELAAAPGCYWPDQLNNPDPLPAYQRMGEEVLRQTEGGVDAFVQSVGTGASFRGLATAMKSALPAVRTVAVEPAESAVLSGGESGSHGIEGVGAGFVVPLWQPELADEVHPVSTENARMAARMLAREEGICAGTSTGANFVAALEVAKELGPGHTVVTLACDSGMKYLSTPLYRRK